MGRYDKYDPKVGGFRAPLAADFDPDNLEKVLGVGLDTNGRVVVGAGANWRAWFVCSYQARKAGEVIDVMTSGEITNLDRVMKTLFLERISVILARFTIRTLLVLLPILMRKALCELGIRLRDSV